MGSKRKVWLESPDNASYLFKYVRQDAVGSVYGDDWAEKLAAELARLLGLPAATVDLASRGGDPGVVCRRVNDPAVLELAHGNELLGARESGYDMTLKREHPRYTVPVVQGCIRDAGAPAGYAELRDLTAFDVWAGYLVFDAWIANTDRHHENWGVLVDRQDGSRRLAPSFDHGSSLGFNQSPSEHRHQGQRHRRLGALVRSRPEQPLRRKAESRGRRRGSARSRRTRSMAPLDVAAAASRLGGLERPDSPRSDRQNVGGSPYLRQ